MDRGIDKEVRARALELAIAACQQSGSFKADILDMAEAFDLFMQGREAKDGDAA